MYPKRALVLMAVVAFWAPAAIVEAARFGRLEATCPACQQNACPDCQQAQAAPEARVTSLPEDGQASYVTLMVHADWQSRPEEVSQIEDWKVRATAVAGPGAHWLLYTEDEAMYRERLAQSNRVLPAIMVQDHQGRVLFKDYAVLAKTADGKAIYQDYAAQAKHAPAGIVHFVSGMQPVDAPGEVDVGVSLFKRHKKCCPGPAPCPGPGPDKVDVNVLSMPAVPDKVPDKVTQPDKSTKEDKAFGPILAVLCGLIFAGVTMGCLWSVVKGKLQSYK